MNKVKLKVISTFLVLILIGGFFMPLTAEGAEKGRKAPDGSPIVECSYDSVTDGKYLYYCPDWAFGLIKRNLKTGKEVVISKMSGVRYLSIHGNNIYFSYSKSSSITSEPYIFKMDKNGKNLKRLSLGESPIIIGKYIYYVGGKLINAPNRGINFLSNGIYRMSLSGNDKKKIVSKDTYKIGKWGNKIYYAKFTSSSPPESYYDLSDNNVTRKIILSGEYNVKTAKKFKVSNEEKVLEGSYKDGKFRYKTIATFKGENIEEINSCGSNLMVFTNAYDEKTGYSTGKYYMLNSKGKKVLLKKWLLAG